MQTYDLREGMNDFDLISFDEYREDFLWNTMEGECVSIDEMDTKHIFNCFKMIFNHLAETYNLPTVWHQHRYGEYLVRAVEAPEDLVIQLQFFYLEIERRSDLPERYKEPFEKIKQILQSLFTLKLNKRIAAIDDKVKELILIPYRIYSQTTKEQSEESFREKLKSERGLI